MTLQNITTLLWDNDGVLVDTERYFFKASQEVLARHGVDLTLECFTDISLTRGGSVLHLLSRRGYADKQILDLRAERNHIYNTYLQTVDLVLPGVEEVLARLRPHFRMFIVTGSGRTHFETMHERTGLLNFFDGHITSDEFSPNKPSPVPYLVAMDRFGVEPERALAIEDSPRGVASAKAASLFCIAIPNPLTRHFDYSRADRVLASIDDLPAFPGLLPPVEASPLCR